MRLGTENRRAVSLMVVLALLLVFFVWRAYRASEAASGATTQPKATAASDRPSPATARPGRSTRKAATLPATRSLDPTLRTDLLKISEDREYTGGNRNIFAAYTPPEPPAPCDGTRDKKTGKCIPRPVVVQETGPVCPGPDPRCPPPPIPLKFYGFASKPGEQKKVFLASGEDVIVGVEGDLVLRRYRILKINNTSVEIEDILNNNKQTIPLSSG